MEGVLAVIGNSTPITPLHCSREVFSPQCALTQDEKARRDALAGLRLIVSSLSILGASSILYSALRRKRVFSPQVHPLFVLSIADLLLALLWGVGALLWLARTEDLKRGWCMAVSLTTIIIECVTINLTLVYAILAYKHIKNLDLGKQNPVHYGYSTAGVLTAGTTTGQVKTRYQALLSTTLYLVAWLLPIVILMVPFALLVSINEYDILSHILDCSCWCLPSFGNVIPAAVASNNATARYSYEFNKVLLLYSVVISANYLTVFLSLLVCYTKILRYIQSLKREYNSFHGARRYGTIKVQINQAQSQARRRVVSFIIIFILSGLFNLVLSIVILQHMAKSLVHDDIHNLPLYIDHSHNLPAYVYAVFYMQSLTVPLQGFLNAMVYGWTRDDFVKTVVTDPPISSIATPPRPVGYHGNNDPSSNDEDYYEDDKTLIQTIPSGEDSMNADHHSDIENQTDFEK